MRRFYSAVLEDPIIGFIFTDVAKINLEDHIEVVGDFWEDVVFARQSSKKHYSGNLMKIHLDLAKEIELRPGHFTRWLYLFNQALDQYQGSNAELMRLRAENVAKSISAALSSSKRSSLRLTL